MDYSKMKELASKIEAMLFVSDEPVSTIKLSEILKSSLAETDEVLTVLSQQLEEDGRGIQLREVAGGWRLYTHPAHHALIEEFVISWDTQKLSQAALETLSVVAYNQPATRNMISSIRGVNSDGVVSSLIEKGLIKEAGRDNSPGSPLLYATTKTFLEKFGLRTIKDLPNLEDFAPNEESKALIRERLSARGAIDDLGLREADEEEFEQGAEHLAEVEQGAEPEQLGEQGAETVAELDRGAEPVAELEEENNEASEISG